METTENAHAKIERFERNLRVELNEQEIAERANRAAHLVAEREQKEDDRKASNKQMAAQTAELDAELRKVSTEVRDRATYRPIQCERAFIYRTGNVTERRLDTGKVLSERPMSDRERQQELPLDDVEEMQRKSAAGESDIPPAFRTAKPNGAKKRGRKTRAPESD
jgi:hypothetical protein